MSRMALAVWLALLATLLMACGSVTLRFGFEDSSLAATSWHLRTVGNSPVNSAEELSIEFSQEGWEMQGWAGCNAYSGQYGLDGDGFVTREMQWSERGCPTQELHELEEAFLDALVAAESFEQSGSQLTLKGGRELVFELQE